MASIQFASLAIGIDEYPNGFYQGQESPLTCASADVGRIHAWISSTFPRDSSNHAALRNSEATYAAIRSAFEVIARLQDLDFVLVYFAGHGRRTKEGASFCAYDHTADGPKLDVQSIDDMLSSVRAKNVLLFLDCCHAEAVLWRSEFFSRLEGARSRLFVASCQADQLAYEDDLVRSSTDASGSSLLTVALFEKFGEATRVGSGHIAINEDLFPYLKRRVPALAFRLKKRARQEPVSGGLSSDNIYLPIAPLIRPPPTTFRALLARWRSLIVGTCAIAALLIVAIYIATWHLEFSSRGNLALFQGPSWLPSLPGDLLLRSELPLSLTDITEESSFRSAALSRKIEGVWWQTGRLGQRRWLQVVEGALKPGIDAYLTALNGMQQDLKTVEFTLIDPTSFDFKTAGAHKSGYSSLIFGPIPIDIENLIAIGAASVLGQPPEIGNLIRPIVHHRDIKTFNSNACSAAITYDYLDWDQGDFWQALSLWAAAADDADLFRFLLFEARVLDIILRAEPPRPQFPVAASLDYILFSAAKFRHLVRSYALGRLLRHGNVLNNSDLEELSELNASGCNMMADVILGWLAMERTDLALPERILADLTTSPAKYGKRGETVVKLLLETYEEICIREALKDVSRGWSLLSRLPQWVGLNDRHRMAMRLIAGSGMIGEVEDILFKTVEDWPRSIATTAVSPAWAQTFSEELLHPDLALQVLSVGIPKMSPDSRKRFLRLKDSIERIAKSDGMAAIAAALNAYAEGLSQLGPLRQDVSGYLFSDVVGGDGGKRKILFDSRLLILARMAARGYRDPRLTEALFDLANPIPGIYFSDWRGALDARSDVDWMLAARAGIRFRDAAPSPVELVTTIRQLRGDARRRRSEILMVQEYLRDHSATEKRKWVADLSALAAAEGEPELRADIASLAVRIFASIELEDLVSGH
ncbi:MAG: caspase domain-containing protein [Beijerinckiaceae bacterium]|jgi:hypothetical protein